MATKRFINSRYIRHPIFCIISFVSGIVLASWLMCSDQGSPKCDTVPTRSTTVYYNETYTTASQDSPVEHTSNKSTVLPPTREPYPPLINKKDLLITPRSCPENLFLLILVVTSSRNFEARKAIRRSWGEDTSKKNESSLDSFRVVYVVGSDGENDRLIKTEAKRYRDMLRGGFNDVYRQNNEHTVKALFGFKWAMTSCKAKFILRASSDTFVNVPEITSFLKTKSTPDRPASGIYMGFCHGMSTGGANVVRNPGSQWYISEEEWPDTYLPPYASSMGILFTYDVVDKIASLSVKEKLIHIDDVYLGIMTNKLSINCQDESSKFDTSYTTMLSECEDLGFCIVGGVPSKDMFYLNQNVNNLREICQRSDDD